VETPCYASLVGGLERLFGSLVASGQLGLVGVGDLFLFQSPNLMAFVQVVAAEAGIWHIQVRGLEYAQETICHRGERQTLGEFADVPRDDRGPSVVLGLEGLLCNHQLRQLGLPVPMYDVSIVDAATAWAGLDANDAKTWFMLALLAIVESGRRRPPERREDPPAEMSNLIGRLGLAFAAEQLGDLGGIWAEIAESCFPDGGALLPQGVIDAYEGHGGDDSDAETAAIVLGAGVAFLAQAGVMTGLEDLRDAF
jgi:hypothetical protein